MMRFRTLPSRFSILPPLRLALPVLALAACGSPDDGNAGDGMGIGADADPTNGSADAGPTTPRSDAAPNICDSIALVAEALPPRVMILQDLSSSLTSNSRWDNMKPAMSQVVDTYNTEFALGLVPFSTTILDGGSDDLDCTVNRSHVIAPAIGNAAAIKSKVYGLNASDLVGGTPTYDGLIAASEQLVGQDPGDGSGRVAILVTDGAPNCLDGTGDSTSDANKERVRATIEGLFLNDAVTTYVVGYDLSGALQATMDGWAEAGGSGTSFAADNATALIQQMDTIKAALIPCEYTLNDEVVDPDYVSVKIDDNSHIYNDPNGWSLGADNKTITLGGSSCDLLRNGDAHDLAVTVECVIQID